MKWPPDDSGLIAEIIPHTVLELDDQNTGKQGTYDNITQHRTVPSDGVELGVTLYQSAMENKYPDLHSPHKRQ